LLPQAVFCLGANPAARQLAITCTPALPPRPVPGAELLLFNNRCQLISALAIPGVSVTGSAGTADSPLTGGADLMLGVPSGTTAGYATWGHNPYTSWGGSGYLSAACSQGATWTVTFPPTTVSQAMLVTRQDGTNNPIINRPIINRYNITLRDAAGAVVESRTLWSNNTVIVRSFPSAPYLPVAQVLPNPLSVAQLRARDTMIRYVRLSTATSTTGTWLVRGSGWFAEAPVVAVHCSGRGRHSRAPTTPVRHHLLSFRSCPPFLPRGFAAHQGDARV
jgi:hypothetical protein